MAKCLTGLAHFVGEADWAIAIKRAERVCAASPVLAWIADAFINVYRKVLRSEGLEYSEQADRFLRGDHPRLHA